jgi:hypothetical protein
VFSYEIEILRIIAIFFIGVIMFFGLLDVNELISNTRPLKRKKKRRIKPEKDRKQLVFILFGIAICFITALIFLIIKLILRGEI